MLFIAANNLSNAVLHGRRISFSMMRGNLISVVSLSVEIAMSINNYWQDNSIGNLRRKHSPLFSLVGSWKIVAIFLGFCDSDLSAGILRDPASIPTSSEI